MKRNGAFFIFVIFFLFFAHNQVSAQRGSRAQEVIEIRLASPLPRNSDWGRGLDRMASEWARITNNQVKLRIIHDGLEGGEAKMLSSLSANNIQAALFISTGLSEICPAIMTLSVPFLIKNNEELDLVLKDALPVLDNQMSRTNFTVISWSKGGWVNFFSKETVFSPDDLRRQRIATSPELKDINTVFRTMGFQAVETEMGEIGPKLANNVINATYLIPELVAPMGLHRYLSNMLDLPISPIMGAIVMNRVTWNKISPEHQAQLMNATRRIVSEFEVAMTRASVNAVSAMQRDGLKVNRPTQVQEDQWRSEVNKAMPMLLGNAFDRALYTQINEILERARSKR